MKNIEKILHSLAHLLAMAVLGKFPNTKLGIGPIIENGFYYDFDIIEADKRGFSDTKGRLTRITPDDLPKLEKKMRELIKQDLKFKKEVITLAEAKKIFKNQPYKLEFVKELQKNKKPITIYKTFTQHQGKSTQNQNKSAFIDLCAGPHIKSTNELNSDVFKLTKIAGAYWKGDEKNQMLTRIYGVAFETKKELGEYLELQKEIEKRDHKKLGPKLGLFMFHETAPGMVYWLPKGLFIFNELINFWRNEHQKRGYQEIKSPLINKKELYEISGHWEHYRQDMFIFNTKEKETYALKPMNCPNAMVVFDSQIRSYRNLPLRLSDTDALHRYELSGTLNGLLRVREFSQDDAHIFISENQIKEEYLKILEITERFYSIFNLDYSFRLGTRPEKFMGDLKTWNMAEKELENILKKCGKSYTISKKDGTFYGPKIDILMKDLLGREWQMGTIQLDFQIPKRFKLKYIDKNGKEETPIVIHRVIYGSLERFIGILIEHFAGAFPVWLSPIQAIIIPISEKFADYGKKINLKLLENGIRAEISDDNETLGKRIREAELQKIPYVLVVGEKEIKNKSVNIRHYSRGQEGEIKTEKIIEKIKKEIENKVI